MTDWPRPDCVANGCHGCFGATLSCWHTFRCVLDPAIDKHRCAASWMPVLEAIVLALTVGLIAYLVTNHR